MIIDALLKLGLVVVQWFWSLIPAWTIEIPDSTMGLVSELSMWNKLVPVAEFMLITGGLGSLFAVLLVLWAILWIIDKVFALIP